MGLTSLFNPYTYIAGAVVVASIGGTFYYQSRQIHHYHQLFDAEHDNVTSLNTVIQTMKHSQENQTKVSEGNINKVLVLPSETKTIIKTIHDAPESKECVTPGLDILKENT